MDSKNEIKKLSIYPILILEEYLPHGLRHKIFRVASPILLLLLLFLGFAFFAQNFSIFPRTVVAPLISFTPRVAGIFLLLFALWLSVYLLEVFYRGLYFHNRGWKIKNPTSTLLTKEGRRWGISSEVAALFYMSRDGDIIREFFRSPVGSYTLLRSGITAEDIEEFLHKRENILQLTLADLANDEVSTMGDFAIFIFKNYPDFSDFLFAKGVSEKEFRGAAEWVERDDQMVTFAERWWARDHLAKFGSLGRNFAYGQTYRLEKYSQELTVGTASPYSRKPHWETEVRALAAALAKSKSSNAILVGEEVSGLQDVVAEFAHEIDAGEVPAELSRKRLLAIDTNLLTAAMKEKGEFEEEFIRLLNEAEHAGNVVLIFENFPSFVASAHSLGADAVDLMNPYLASSHVKVVALADREAYHRVLAQNGEFSSHFEKVSVNEPEDFRTLELLEDGAAALEARYGVFFTYRAIEEVLASARNYITEGVMPEKATDLLIEVASYMSGENKTYIDKEHVLEFVKFKTNIPVGEISGEEKTKLQNLEGELHKRVVGQDDAVKAVTDSMRRSRAGVRNPSKPIGSFLFLGPTGVGKTETAKAVAAVFFGDEEKMIRFDMSEYSQMDALSQLIGGFESGRPGTLTMALKNFPYGVLLLDEFEKANGDVHNLFLQILDEGFFSDALGHRVNARNMIIIATSNAGSALIYEAIKKGENIQGYKKYIVDAIIKMGILKPELLNRFDGVILFSPLGKEELREIAKIQLGNLAARLKDEQGFKLVINEPLIAAIMKEGQDPMFGGRPMVRVIKEKVEKIIADKIIAGTIHTGDTVELTEGELA